MTETQTSAFARQIAETISEYDKLMDLKKEAWHFRLSDNAQNSFHQKEETPVVLIFNLKDPNTARNIAYQVNEVLEANTSIEGEGRFLTCFYAMQEPLLGRS